MEITISQTTAGAAHQVNWVAVCQPIFISPTETWTCVVHMGDLFFGGGNEENIPCCKNWGDQFFARLTDRCIIAQSGDSIAIFTSEVHRIHCRLGLCPRSKWGPGIAPGPDLKKAGSQDPTEGLSWDRTLIYFLFLPRIRDTKWHQKHHTLI